MKVKHNDDTVYSALYEKAVDVQRRWASWARCRDIETDQTCLPAETPYQFWKTNMHLSFADQQLVDSDPLLFQGHVRLKA